VGCGGCDRLFMLFPPQAAAKKHCDAMPGVRV